MIRLVFATHNEHKAREVAQMLDNARFEVAPLQDIGCSEDIPETQPTIPGNAIQKAQYVYERYGVNCFAEDTGLEIDALGGAPGVYTARYAGEAKDPRANMEKVLAEMAGRTDRSARFRTVVALVLDGALYTFEGVAEGHIREALSGEGGFGYDPIFQPEGYPVTFAEMDAAEKNRISHRAKAIGQLVEFLR